MFKNLRDKLKGVSKQLEDELEAQLEDQLERELAEELAKQTAPEPSAQVTPEPAAPVEEPQPEASPEEPAPAPEPAALDEAPPRAPEAPTPDPTPDPEPEAAPEPAPEPAAAQPVAEAAPPAAAEAAAPVERITGRKQFTDQEIHERLERELREATEVQKEVEAAARESGGLTKYTINEDVLDDILWELEIGLLESDVALPVIEAIKTEVKDQLLSLAVGGRSPGEVVEKVLRRAVLRVLNINAFDFDGWVDERLEAKKPLVVMFVGVNGTGKTTSIARIAHRLKERGTTCVMAAGDTFRAGAIEQLSQHGDVLGIKVVKHSAGADPAAVAYDAIEHAKARHKDVVLLDTAGRMQTNTNLMDEMDKIRRVAKPDLVVFVGDSLAGNDAVEQARRFDDVVDIDGAILTKTDVDAKGGAALSVAYTINKPLLFIGVGQDYGDLEPFDAQRMVERLFGGDEGPA